MPDRPRVAGLIAVRKPFRREGEDQRRRELVEATLAVIADKGLEHATVREIAVRAGVTPGLIRHYFTGKDELVIAAYSHHVDTMRLASERAIGSAGGDPVARLATFVAANLSPPILDPVNLSLWAAFITLIRTEPAMDAVHAESYQGYRREAERLVGTAFKSLGRQISSRQVRHLGIALNALIDGLWLEGSLSPSDFAEGELSDIGLSTASALLGMELKTAGAA